MFLALEHMLVLRNMMSGGWVVCFLGGVGGGVGCFRSLHLHASWCYATWCFLHWNTSLLLRNMMFLTLEDIFTATQHDVSCTISASRMKKRTWVFWQKFQRYSTLELLESICTSMEHWREKPSDEDDFLLKHNFFYKNEKTEFRKILTNRFAFKHLIYNGRHLEWQCIISKKKVNTCAAIEGRCTLVFPAFWISAVISVDEAIVGSHVVQSGACGMQRFCLPELCRHKLLTRGYILDLPSTQ